MTKSKFLREIQQVDGDGNIVQMSVYHHEGGGIFAIDSSFIEQVADDGVIPDPFNKGEMVELLD